MSGVELPAAMITTAMTKVEARVCVGIDRCYAFPHRLEDARETGTPNGRCEVGWVVSKAGRESWDVWLAVSTGLVKLLQQAAACADGFYACFMLQNDVTQYSNMVTSCYTTMWHSIPRAAMLTSKFAANASVTSSACNRNTEARFDNVRMDPAHARSRHRDVPNRGTPHAYVSRERQACAGLAASCP
jgi:hypothetical protein